MAERTGETENTVRAWKMGFARFAMMGLLND
jgi:hypothetical protein